MRIVNGPEIVTPSAGQRNLPVPRRVTAIAARPEPRRPQWNDRPAASSFRGRVIDLLV